MSLSLGIIGWPVSHSLSPAIHEAGLEACGLTGTYVRFAIEPASLGKELSALRQNGLRGFNVTVPHKCSVMEYLDEVDPTAQRIGAVNTVYTEGERWVGTNTDGEGFIRSLHEAGHDPAGGHAVILGTGGAARAVADGLAAAGVSSLGITGRSFAKAEALREHLAEHYPALNLQALLYGDGLGKALARASLVVQSTNATMEGNPDRETFLRRVPFRCLANGALAVDLVYRPRETSFLRAAQAEGARTLDGLGMLRHQAFLAFERWTGRPAPAPAMTEALYRALTAL